MSADAFERRVRRLRERYYAQVREREASQQESEQQSGGDKALADMTVPELRAYAAEHKINLGGARARDGIIAAIEAHETGDGIGAGGAA